MAIQIRRGTNAQWETSKSNIVAGEPAVATDSKRAFIGTSTGHYMELANIESVAPAFSTSTTYHTGDVVTYQGLMWVAITETSGVFKSADWEQMSIGNMLSRFNEHLYDGYETATIEDTPLATFSDGAGDIAVKDLQVSIKAVQNLNGYDHPWAGGGGKNLCPPLTWKGEANNSTGNYNVGTNTGVASTAELIPVDFTNNTTYVLSYDLSTLPEGAKNMIFAYNANKEFLGRMNGQATNPRTFNKDSFTTATTSATGDPAYIRVKAYNVVYTEEEIANGKFQVEVGDTATTYSPYSNICPIVGWDYVKTYVSGKNILSTQNVANGSYGGISVTRNADGSLTINGTGNTVVLGNISTGLYGTAEAQNDGTKHIPNGEWVLSTGLTSNIGISLQLYGTNNSSGTDDLHSIASATTTSARFTIDDTYRFNYVRLRVNGTFNNVTIYPKIYPYEIYNDPYEQGKINTYTSSLGSTRYGGVFDVTTGKLTVTHGYVDLGTLNWGFNPDVGHQYFSTLDISNIKLPSTLGTPANLVCSHYTTDSYSVIYANTKDGTIGLSTSGRMAIFDSQKNSMTAEQFKTAMSGVQLVYELATPTSTFISPTQVNTHYHDNNLWVDCGDVEVLVYRITRH